MPAITGVPAGVDVDATGARARAAPAGNRETFPCAIWIPWHAHGDDESEPGQYRRSGRVPGLLEHGWHAGSGDPGPGLRTFPAHARGGVLALAAEVRRPRAAAATPGIAGKAA